jgi:hypothetical protein
LDGYTAGLTAVGGGVEVSGISYFITLRLLFSEKTSTVLFLLGNWLEVFIVVLMVNLSFWFMLACSSIPVLFYEAIHASGFSG